MINNRIVIFLFLAMSLFSLAVLAAESDNPCVASNALISIINRPSNADSVCVVPQKHAVLEMGYQYQNLLYGGYIRGGQAQNFPQTELRIGMPLQTEFTLLMPNYYRLTVPPHAGWTASGIEVKHQFPTMHNVLTAIELDTFLPTGSNAFSSQAAGGALNGILSYNFTDVLSMTTMLGVSTLSYPPNSGGQYFTSVNPDILVSWLAIDSLDFYLEFFGQTRTGPGQGSGFNIDAGMIYLVTKNLTIDFSVGQRISGLLGGYNHYVGVGGAIEF